ncbi:hypothetical protein F4677DRAFT_61957 [Hypoxylon crocopeplum]|nr:hypothetical protein F4677DRAFT_61957 [Hypoxylon crocopeplum]
MARQHVTVPKRRGPKKIADRIPNATWKKHKPCLRKLYLTDRLPLPQVMTEMKKKNFEASQKQYRYRFEMWKWLKYGQNRSQGPGIDQNQRLRVLNSSIANFEGSDHTYDGSDTPPSSYDGEEVRGKDKCLLRQQLISVFEVGSFPVGEDMNRIVAVQYDGLAGVQYSDYKDTVIRRLAPMLRLEGGSINIVAYHHFNFALESVIGQLWQDEFDESRDEDRLEPAISRLKVFEQYQEYLPLDEYSPASVCLLLCFHWVQRQLTCCPPKNSALSHFDMLGVGAGDGELDIPMQDVCLFVYLFDIWVSQGAQSSSDSWDRHCEGALGISPAQTLRVMSCLILGMAAAQDGGSPKDMNADHDALVNFALCGVKAVEEAYSNDTRGLVEDFITEFVWVHDLNRQADEFEEKAWKAAHAYADKKLRVYPDPRYPESRFSNGARTLGDESDSSDLESN